MVIKVSLSLKDQGAGIASGGGLQKCPEQAERRRPEERKRNQRHQDKVRESAIDGDTESGETPMGKSEAAAAVGREIVKAMSQPGQAGAIGRRIL